jgi:hypothetical protein
MLAELLLFSSLAAAAPAHQEQAHYVAGQLRGEVDALVGEVGEEELEESGKKLDKVIDKLVRRIGTLKADPKAASMGAPLERVADALRSFPNRDYAKKHPAELLRSIADQVEFDADRSASAAELNERLKKSLDLPVTLEALPTDIPLARFVDLGPVFIFLCKHRTSAPEGFADVTEEDLRDGRYHVEIGVKYRGVVTAVYNAEDGDYCWNMSIIHNEIPPQWKKAQGQCHPEVGDLVELRGWSYFDKFHQNETTGEKEFNKNRPTVWEVHPVTGCTILAKAKSRKP